MPSDHGGRGPISSNLRTCSKALVPSNPPVEDAGGAIAGVVAWVVAESAAAGERFMTADCLSQPETHSNARPTIMKTSFRISCLKCIALTYMTERIPVIGRTDLPDSSKRQRIIRRCHRRQFRS